MNLKLFLLNIFIIIILTGCDNLITDYKLDTDTDLLKDMDLLEYIEEGNDTALSIYYDAIKYAQLEMIVSKGNQTRIVPSNQAMRNMLNSVGVSQITQLNPNVIKNLVLYLIIPNEHKSISLDADRVNGFLTLSGDSLFISRNSTQNDPYRMFINATGEFIPSSVQISKQDFVFKDGIMHVVDMFPVFRKKVMSPDAIPDGVDYSLAQKDTIWISEDASVYQPSKTKNYGMDLTQLVARSGYTRYSFLKFNLKPIGFIDNLVSAKLNMCVQKINGSNYIPLCGIYETIGDWTEMSLIWNNMPAFGVEVSSSELKLGWNTISIISSIKKLYEEEKQSVSYGLKALNGGDIPSSSVMIYNKEHSANKPPFISLMSAIPSEISPDVTLPVAINTTDGIARLLKSDLSFSGPSSTYKYTDNNIIYVLVTPPNDGTLTLFGLPMKRNSQFTQEELALGAVKYIANNNSGVNDSFVLKAQDYIGGVYSELINVNIR